MVLDIITRQDDDTFRLMLHIASKLVHRIGGQVSVLWVSQGSWTHSTLVNEGYSSAGQLILIAKQNLPGCETAILSDVRLWAIMAGDSDVV